MWKSTNRGPKPNKQKDLKVWKLRTEKQLSYREIGRIMGVDAKAVWKRYQRAVVKRGEGKY